MKTAEIVGIVVGSLVLLYLIIQAVLAIVAVYMQRDVDAQAAAYAAEPWHEWMAHISDRSTRVVRDVVLIGTHDSGANALNFSAPYLARQSFTWAIPFRFFIGHGISLFSVTQNQTLTEQAMAGTRSFDLRVALDTKGEFVLWHGFRTGSTLASALAELAAFLTAHPTECVLAWVRVDDQLDAAATKRFADIVAPYHDMLVPAPLAALSTTTVAEAGGRMFFFTNAPCDGSTPAECPGYGDYGALTGLWPNVWSPDDAAAAVDSDLAAMAPKASAPATVQMSQWIATPQTTQIVGGIVASFLTPALPMSLQSQAMHMNAMLPEFVTTHAAALRERVQLIQADFMQTSQMRALMHGPGSLNPTLAFPIAVQVTA